VTSYPARERGSRWLCDKKKKKGRSAGFVEHARRTPQLARSFCLRTYGARDALMAFPGRSRVASVTLDRLEQSAWLECDPVTQTPMSA